MSGTLIIETNREHDWTAPGRIRRYCLDRLAAVLAETDPESAGQVEHWLDYGDGSADYFRDPTPVRQRSRGEARRHRPGREGGSTCAIGRSSAG